MVQSAATRRALLWIGFAALAIALAFVLGPSLSTLYHIEAGGRALEDAEAFVTAHPGEANPRLDDALRHFSRAAEISPQDGFAYRRWGQALLLAGDNEGARDILLRATELRPNHPLIHIELGYAYDGLGQVDQALAAYEKGGYGPAVEAAIVNYLKVADWQAGAGAADYALQILQEKVLELDPDNLPALYRVYRIYQDTSEQAAAQFAVPIREQLKEMAGKKTTLPTEPRLLSYVEGTAADLVQEGIWNQKQADRALGR